MQLSRRAEYALLALIDLAIEAHRERVQLGDIAARQHIPEKYLEQLLRPLKTAGVVVSTRGSRGGYQLARPASEVTVLEAVEAVEGPLAIEAEGQPDHPAAQVVRRLWSEVGEQLRAALAEVTIAHLAEQYQARRAATDNWVI